MPNVSGQVAYNATHVPVPTTGIPNVAVALYNTTTGMGAVALTDAAGNYLFTNVAAGNYYLIETWGTSGAPTPINFSTSQSAMAQPPEVEPPLSALTVVPPALADALDAVTPNLLKITVAGVDIVDNYFIDGPVGIKPLDFSGVIFNGSNLITVADNGTMGSFAPGTAVITVNPVAPYPGVTPGFTYTTNPNPSDGFYNVMNTRHTIGGFNWWGVSDHTTGIETGRYMTVNGANPGATIFEQNVAVTPNSDYILTGWILNLIALGGYAQPKLALEVLAADGSVLFLQNVNPIPATPIPVWYQNGFKFNTDGNSNITIKVLSDGPAANGNDYLIDDIELYKVTIADLLSVKKTATPSVIYNGSDVVITVVVKNTSPITAKNVIFKDILDPTLVFVPGSVTIDTIPNPIADPNTGFSLGDMPTLTTHTIVFHATATAGPSSVLNSASATYNVFSSGSGDITTRTVNSNTISLHRPLYNLGQPSIDLLESVALGQSAISHIINAEGEKIQAALALPNITKQELLTINASVQKTLDTLTQLENIMSQKLQTVENQLVNCC